MGRWTYYSPLFFGAGLAAIMFATYAKFMPVMPTWRYWLVIVGGCLGVALGCQLLMVATQGAFAQVLPVPGGRSVRGRGAVLAGWTLLLGVVLGFAAVLLGIEQVKSAALLVAGVSLASTLVALITYIWCWPTALRDFADER